MNSFVVAIAVFAVASASPSGLIAGIVPRLNQWGDAGPAGVVTGAGASGPSGVVTVGPSGIVNGAGAIGPNGEHSGIGLIGAAPIALPAPSVITSPDLRFGGIGLSRSVGIAPVGVAPLGLGLGRVGLGPVGLGPIGLGGIGLARGIIGVGPHW